MSGDLIGSRISLISRKDIRWEGILIMVDKENASVTLQGVKSWGTEGRAEGDKQIAPLDRLHSCVQFRGEDIKDLHVHETAEPAPQPPPPPPPAAAVAAAPQPLAPTPAPQPSPPKASVAHPPLPKHASSPPPLPPPPTPTPQEFVAPDVAAGRGRETRDNEGLAEAPTPARTGESGGQSGGEDRSAVPATEAPPATNAPAPLMRDQGQKPGRYQPPHKNPNWKPPPTVQRAPPVPGSGGASSNSGALPGQGNHLLNRRTRGAGSDLLDNEGEFDFQAGLAKFDKEKEMALLAGGVSGMTLHDLKSSPNGPSSVGDEPNGAQDGHTKIAESSELGAAGENTEGDGQGAREGAASSSAIGMDAVTGAAPATAAAAPAERSRSAADGGDFWVEPAVVVKKYNKSSFFDEISCDALDGRGRMPGGRGGERTRNTETFGATSVALASGSRRYGGRGGSNGGYSGGGRRSTYNDGDNNGYRRSHHSERGGGGGGGGGHRHDTGGSWRRN